MMPEMDGFEVCRRLEKANANRLKRHSYNFSDCPYPRQLIRSMGFEVGGVDYITQPIENEEVVARVRTHLIMSQNASRRLQKQNRELTGRNRTSQAN